MPAASGSSIGARQPKTFNLNTYKVHALGDYALTICRYGTTDLYSTEVGKLEHRTSKARYQQTSRNHFTKQLMEIERRQTRLHHIRARIRNDKVTTPSEVIPSDPALHHHIAKSQNFLEIIPSFIQNHAGDPAVKNFVPKLKDHIVPRIKAILAQESMSSQDMPAVPNTFDVGLVPVENNEARREHDGVLFKGDCMFKHQILKINYTSYDVRRSQDVIHEGTLHSDIMVLAHQEGQDTPNPAAWHRFWFARILGIYHVNVVYTGPGMLDYVPRRLDVLWVHWFQHTGDPVAWEDHRLDSISFPPMAGEHAFGFVDPSDVLHGCHVILAFTKGKVHADAIGLSKCARDVQDWRSYYINRCISPTPSYVLHLFLTKVVPLVSRFVDHDMLMRFYWGLTVGYQYTHADTGDQFT
ncbi:hypothetical protein EW146_g9485 [Bondarzewia mesenterica]|uniref:Uncharacterized protein n=1 Tax=Bondarzewia mesenterica TaxID=1095465 RepID=A0A4S4L7R6_9AGAM|nr:hypothetical protein EW146_g9485 [Bondarzewia mesenterica]